MTRPAEVTAWVQEHAPEQQAQIEWLADRVHAADDRITEAVKWHRLTFTVDDSWHHWLCGVQVSSRG